MERDQRFHEWDHEKTSKKKGGAVFISVSDRGEVEVHEGYLSRAEARKLEAKGKGKLDTETKPEKPELTKPMQNYFGLHRHAAVRLELLKHARAPYAFVLDSNSNPGAVLRTTKRLEEFFYEAICSALKSSSSEVKPVEFLGQTAIESDPSTFLPINGVLTRDGDFSGQSLKVVLEANKGNIYARLIPKRALDIAKSEIRSRIKGAPGLAVATGSSSGSFGNNEFGYVNYATLNNASTEKRTVLDFVQFFKSGEVWCVNGSALSGGGDISESIIGIINKMWGVLNDWLETSAPDEKYSLVVGISGLRGRRIAYGSLNHQKTSQFYVDHVSAVFDEPRGITTQEIKEALWKEIDSEL